MTWFAANKKKLADIAERALLTGAQAGLAMVTVDQLGLPKPYIPVIALALSGVKSWVATQLGKKGSAALLPASLDSSK